MLRWLTIAAAIASGMAAGSACLVDVEHRIACGDGYVDRMAGEECDPNDPDSYENECEGTSRPQGIAACDPMTCEIINDRLQCAFCGDGVLDDDFVDPAQTMRLEECDGNIILANCPTAGDLSCDSQCRIDYSKCDLCGNGQVDEDEECDPADSGGIAIPRPCAGAGEFEPLQSPFASHPYTSGYTVRCLSDCTFDRSECGYCGNGVAEGMLEVAISPEQTVKLSRPEECDGNDVDALAVQQKYPQCSGEFVTANAGCDDGCNLIEREGPPCCLATAAPCPAEDDTARCCHEYSSPDAEEHCSDPFLPPGAPPENGGAKCN